MPCRRAQIDASLNDAFLCIHHYEGAWTSNTGNGYYGGLQMDRRFMQRYGRGLLGRWGTADNWPAWAQLEVAARAHDSGRGFTPWPNTARSCGLSVLSLRGSSDPGAPMKRAMTQSTAALRPR